MDINNRLQIFKNIKKYFTEAYLDWDEVKNYRPLNLGFNIQPYLIEGIPAISYTLHSGPTILNLESLEYISGVELSEEEYTDLIEFMHARLDGVTNYKIVYEMFVKEFPDCVSYSFNYAMQENESTPKNIEILNKEDKIFSYKNYEIFIPKDQILEDIYIILYDKVNHKEYTYFITQESFIKSYSWTKEFTYIYDNIKDFLEQEYIKKKLLDIVEGYIGGKAIIN